MPEAADPGGLVSADELKELAGWFDEFEFAFDPLSVRAREAEAKFNDRVQELFNMRICPRPSPSRIGFPGLSWPSSSAVPTIPA